MQQVLLGAALLAALCWNLAQASEIKGLRLDSGATGTRAEIELDTQAEYKVISLAGPDRLVLDLADTKVARGLQMPAAAGIVKAVRSGHPQPGITRIVFDLGSSVVALKPRLEPSGKGSRLVLEWPGDGVDPPQAPAVAAVGPTSTPAPRADATAEREAGSEADPHVAATSAAATERLIADLQASRAAGSVALTPAAPAAATVTTTAARAAAVPAQATASAIDKMIAAGTLATSAPAAAQPATPDESAPATTPAPSKTLRPARGVGMRPLVVAIDAGHGGQDPGAIGKSGRREKDITLAVARELARQINATPGLKAYLTRNSDVFIPLNRRAQMARAAKADLFVSVHADAAENRSATGASVFVLSLKGASSQRARWLADKENASDLIGGVSLKSSNMLASVLLDLTQSGHMKASEDAAGHVLDSLGQVGNTRRVERANFAVLRTSDMPSMLVETGFISNPEEERQLGDARYQRKLADAMLQGISTYFTRQPPPGTLFAARAAAESSTTGAVGGGSP